MYVLKGKNLSSTSADFVTTVKITELFIYEKLVRVYSTY